MSLSRGNWGFLVSGFSGDFFGGKSLLTPGSGLPQGHGSSEACVFQQSPWQTWVLIYTGKTPHSGGRERDLRAIFTDALSSIAPYHLSSHPVHNHLGIIALSLPKHSRSQSERRECQHFSSVRWRTTGKGWSKSVVWNFSLCENHLEGLLQHKLLSPPPEFLLNRGPITGISDESPGDVDAAGWEATLWEPLA